MNPHQATISILKGENTLSDFSNSISDIRKTINKELKSLNDNYSQAGSQLTFSSPQAMLKEAKVAIDSGANSNAARQRFLEAYPGESTLWKNYFNE